MKLNKITALFAAVVMTMTITGCSDDDNLTPLDKSTATVRNTTYNTLTFAWGKVDNAQQYSCQLSKTATGDILTTEITRQPIATFTDLEASTDYTLTVFAYAVIGSGHTTSEPIVLTARTSDLTAIDTPHPEMTREVNTVVFQWEHVASSIGYAWQLLDADGNEVEAGETRSLNVDFTDLADGSYVFSIVAEIDEPGFTNSAAATVNFEFVRIHEKLWQTTGTYTSALTSAQWDATLIAYDDNSFTIQAWYGVEGYDLTFTIDESNADNKFILSSETYTYNTADGSYSVPTGLASPATVKVFPADNRCAFTGTDGVGSVQLDVSDGTTTGTDKLSWGEVSIDELCGEWVVTTSYKDYDFGNINETKTVTVTKVNDNTIRIPVPISDYWSYTADIVVDLETMKYTIAPVENIAGYYTFASASGPDVSLTGTISKSRFVISDWTYWWSGYCYTDEDYSSTAIFTRP